MRALTCDDCGKRTTKPAIDLGLLVFCPRCCGRHGMFPGEHGTAKSYDEWKRLAHLKHRESVPAGSGAGDG